MWSCTVNISQGRIKELLKVSSIYLDINHYAEVQGITCKAFEHYKVILPLAILCMTATSSHKPISLIKEKEAYGGPYPGNLPI